MPSKKNYRSRTRKIRSRKIKGGASYFEPITQYLNITSGTNETISKMNDDKNLLNDQMSQLTKTYNNIVANVYQLESRINGLSDIHEKCTSLHPEISSPKSGEGIFSSFFNSENKNSKVVDKSNETTTANSSTENTTESTKPQEEYKYSNNETTTANSSTENTTESTIPQEEYTSSNDFSEPSSLSNENAYPEYTNSTDYSEPSSLSKENAYPESGSEQTYPDSTSQKPYTSDQYAGEYQDKETTTRIGGKYHSRKYKKRTKRFSRK